MSQGEQERQYKSRTGAHNTYGPAHITGNAVVHQGDISSDVYVRELHLHFRPYSEPPQLAHPVARLSHYALTFLELGERIIQYEHQPESSVVDKIQWNNLPDLLNNIQALQGLLAELPFITAQLIISRSGTRPSISRSYPSTELSAAVTANALSDATAHSDTIAPFQQAILEFHTQEVIADDILTPRLSKLIEHLKQLWEQCGFLDQVKNLISYQSSVENELNQIVNVSNITPAEPIDEILAINGIGYGSQPIPYMQENSMAIIANSARKSVYADTSAKSLTTYNLDDETIRKSFTQLDDRPPSSQPHIQKTPDLVAKILSLLYFEGESDREIEVKPAHTRTFSWIFIRSDSLFKSWLGNDQTCFWINGKAGSGKSTLMKYIKQNPLLRTHLSRWAFTRKIVIATFFFWNAGRTLQKSQEGMLRSLLHQILQQQPDLVLLVFPKICQDVLRNASGTLGDRGSLRMLSLPRLIEAFHLLAERLPGDVAIFLQIDGVDEFAGDHYEIAKFLTGLTQNPAIKLLVSSRPIPECYHAFIPYPSMRLQDLTQADIQVYIEDKLLRDALSVEREILQPGISQDIEAALVKKASGVFLWIVLVVKSILLSLRKYDARESLLAVIDDLPSDLERLYDHMFSKLDADEQQAGAKLLQFMVLAMKRQPCPLTATQLYVAETPDGKFDLSDLAVFYDDQLTEARIKFVDGRLRSRCCGLLEVQYRGWSGCPLAEPEVDFLHRTVYDYLRSDKTWNKVIELFCLDDAAANISLLASCAHRMKRQVAGYGLRPSVSHYAPQASDSKLRDSGATKGLLLDLFATSLRCSVDLQAKGQTVYLPLLEIADNEMLRYAKTKDDLVSYFEALRTFETRCITSSARKHVETASQNTHSEVSTIRMTQTSHTFIGTEPEESGPVDADCILRTGNSTYRSICAFATLPLVEYVKHKIATSTADPADKRRVLLYLLDACRSTISSFLSILTRNIAAVIDTGIDPNEPTECVVQPWLGKPFRAAGIPSHDQAIVVRETRHVVPWRFWVNVCQPARPHHIEITLLLLNAGADIKSSTWREAPDNVLEKLWTAMENFRSTSGSQGPDPKTRAALDQILSIARSNQQRSRKRQSPASLEVEPLPKRPLLTNKRRSV